MKSGILGLALMMAMFLLSGAGMSAASDRMLVELNKLETVGENCQAYMLYRNPTDVTYEKFTMEIAAFDPEGVIQKRLSVAFPPILAQKSFIWIFSFSDISCDKIGSVLLNRFAECKVAGGKEADCLADIDLGSKAGAKFYK